MRNWQPRIWWIVLSLLVLSAGLYIGTAASPALDDDDVDPAHAMISGKCCSAAIFVVPYMDGVRYLVRPPMHSGWSPQSYKLLGETEFATRLPLSLAMVGMVLLTFEFGRRFFSQGVREYTGPWPWPPAWACLFSRGS